MNLSKILLLSPLVRISRILCLFILLRFILLICLSIGFGLSLSRWLVSRLVGFGRLSLSVGRGFIVTCLESGSLTAKIIIILLYNKILYHIEILIYSKMNESKVKHKPINESSVKAKFVLSQCSVQ